MAGETNIRGQMARAGGRYRQGGRSCRASQASVRLDLVFYYEVMRNSYGGKISRVSGFQILDVGKSLVQQKDTNQDSSPLEECHVNQSQLLLVWHLEIQSPPPSKIQTTIHPCPFAFPEGPSSWKTEAGRTEMRSAKKIARRPAPGSKDKMGLRSTEMMEGRHLKIPVERF